MGLFSGGFDPIGAGSTLVTGGAWSTDGKSGWLQGNDPISALTYGSTGGIINPRAARDARADTANNEAQMRADNERLRKDGLAYGDQQFEQIYGTTKNQVGMDMRDIIKRRKDTLTMNDPVANQIRQSGNDAVRQANSSMAQSGVKGGIGAQGINKIKRESTKDVNAQLTKNYMSALDSNQQMTGNIATQSQRLPQVYSQLFQGGQYIPPVGQAPFLGGVFDQGALGGLFSGSIF